MMPRRVDMGGWVGGQANYVLVPYADWNLLKFPDKDQAMEKILDLAMLSDIFPTGYHGAVSAAESPRRIGPSVTPRCYPRPHAVAVRPAAVTGLNEVVCESARVSVIHGSPGVA
jgi:hypothetical protein